MDSARASTPNRRFQGMLSLVVPVYNEEEVIDLTAKRLRGVIDALPCPAEVIFVDDGSHDLTAEFLRRVVFADSRFRCVLLSRNFGHQVALSAGLDYAKGDAVVVLDADLQDPPELIPKMLALWEDGYDVVYGQRASRDGESWFKRFTAALFYRLIRFLSGVQIPADVGDFRLMDRKAIEALRRMPERHRFLRGMAAWVGFKQCPLVYDRAARAGGVTKYPIQRMLTFALDAIFSFSTVPLRLATLAGLAVMAAAIVEIVWTLYLSLVLNAVIPGYTPIFVSVLFLGGLNLVVSGVLGEYIGRIYVEAKGRPLYLVQEFLVNAEAQQHVLSRQ